MQEAAAKSPLSAEAWLHHHDADRADAKALQACVPLELLRRGTESSQ